LHGSEEALPSHPETFSIFNLGKLLTYVTIRDRKRGNYREEWKIPGS